MNNVPMENWVVVVEQGDHSVFPTTPGSQACQLATVAFCKNP